MAKKGEQSGKRPIVIEREILQSPAYLSLTGIAPQVLSLFMCRRQMKQHGSRRKRWIITNNGQIEFTYAEAEEKWGISRPRFQRALEQLIDRGFIDVNVRGAGVCGSKNLYSIVERYRNWGTDRFVEATPPRKTNNRGFRNGHARFGKRPTLTVHRTGTHGGL